MIFTTFVHLAVVVSLWRVGEVGWVTKLVLTLLSFAIWALILWTPAAVIVAQVALIVVIGGTTFGGEWLNQRIR